MEKLILKSLLLMGLIATLQSCSKKNDLPINDEKIQAEQKDGEKLTSTIRLISLPPYGNTFKCQAALEPNIYVAFDLDGDLVSDITFGNGSFLGGLPISSNAGVLKYKNGVGNTSGPYRLKYGQKSPISNAVFTLPNVQTAFPRFYSGGLFYIGFKVKFTTDNKIHFGWAKLRLMGSCSGEVLELAINDAPNTLVFAGEI